MILKAGISPGIAINPGTQFPSWIIEHLDNIDIMIIMSVNLFCRSKIYSGYIGQDGRNSQDVEK